MAIIDELTEEGSGEEAGGDAGGSGESAPGDASDHAPTGGAAK
jgi:hypothetical protein